MTDQPRYGYPPPSPPSWAPPAPAPTMPATVRAATIVTYVCAAVSVAMTLLMVLLMTIVGSVILPMFQRSDRIELVLLALVGLFFSVGCSALACWFAWETGKRKAWARIGLAVCSGLTVTFSLLAFAPPTIVGILGGTAVLVLLFVPESNAWFRDAD